jgi:predicted O-methyltransferase YrrM
MSSRNDYIDEKLYDYILETSLRDSAVLAHLREETSRMPNGVMQISPDQGQFMGLLVKLIGARKILEVGCFTGYSSTVMAQALPDDGTLITCDISEEFTAVAQRYWREAGVAGKIDLRLGEAVNTLAELDDTTIAIRNLNAALRDDDRVDLSLLSIGDGLTLARKR